MSDPKWRGPAWTTPRELKGLESGPEASGKTERRNELAAFLRSRRERITPEDVGLPGGHRRRTAGLRREEVAQLAGVGVTWYTWLEQGRPIRASVQVLEAVARTLRLDTVERQHLFRLAEVPDTATLADGGPRLRPQIQAILDGLNPMPASVVTERFDILAWNAAYAVLIPRTAEDPPAKRNTLLYCFTRSECCSAIENRADQRAAMVAQLRAAYGHHVGDPAWTGFIRRMEAASPEFAAMWATQDVAPAGLLRQGVPASALPAPGDDLHQLRGADGAGHPDGGLHPRQRRHPRGAWNGSSRTRSSTTSPAGRPTRREPAIW